SRLGHAGERVHIGAVHIKLGAPGVEYFRDLRDALLEDAQGRRVCDHQRGDVFVDDISQLVDVDLPARVGADVFDFVTRDDGGGGIRSMSRIRDEDLLARVAAALEVSADQQQAGQFALCAGGGLQRCGIHAGDLEQAFLQGEENLQAT